MAIVKMKRLRLIAPSFDKRKLLRDMTRCGCVEIESGEKLLSDPHWAEMLRRIEEEPPGVASSLSEITSALATLSRYAHEKKPFLAPRRKVSESELYSEEQMEDTLSIAARINDRAKDIAGLHSEEGRLLAKKLSLEPWAGLDVPLDFRAGNTFSFIIGVCPVTAAFEELQDGLTEIKECQLSLIGSDREQHYITLLCHIAQEESALEVLKSKGFSRVTFKDVQGTAAENIRMIEARIAEVEQDREALIQAILEMKDQRNALEQAMDALSLENTRENVIASLTETSQTTYIEGWVPKEAEKTVVDVLEKNGCAYEFFEPAEDEEPPVAMKNNRFVTPFGMITELYALPTYKSGLDPNPFMAPFFFLFFGLMLGDFFYGLVLFLAGFILLKKAQPTGGMKNMMKIAVFCGISTMMWGILFGSYFGNMIPTVTQMVTGTAVTPKPLLFDPLADPMTLFMVALAFGFIQIFVGMGLNGYMMIREGRPFDAICDVGFWYLILGGAVLTLLVSQQVGLICMAVGAIGVVCTGGRSKKGILKKIASGLGSLYGVTSYLADILSYSRLLALSLATAVIAQVMNTMGSLGGNSWIGWILFVVVFVIGHAFNIAINLLGTFVHTSRLQYIEFFGKFYQPGGRAFNPLYYKTKYVEVIKEEN